MSSLDLAKRHGISVELTAQNGDKTIIVGGVMRDNQTKTTGDKNMTTKININHININHINQTEKYVSFPFVVEVAAWEDCGQSDYWGAHSENEAREILDREIEECKKWAMAELDECPTDWEPGSAKIYVRPEADEDGDIADLSYWETL